MQEPMARFRKVSIRVGGRELLHSIDLEIGRRESFANDGSDYQTHPDFPSA